MLSPLSVCIFSLKLKNTNRERVCGYIAELINFVIRNNLNNDVEVCFLLRFILVFKPASGLKTKPCGKIKLRRNKHLKALYRALPEPAS